MVKVTNEQLIYAQEMVRSSFVDFVNSHIGEIFNRVTMAPWIESNQRNIEESTGAIVLADLNFIDFEVKFTLIKGENKMTFYIDLPRW